MSKCKVVYTEEFYESLLLAKQYISFELGSPLTANRFVDGILDVIDKKSCTPCIAAKRLTIENVPCYVVSYKNWNIYYSVENNVMKVLELTHQIQNRAR